MLDVVTWRKGVFDFSAAFIESLEKELNQADFAVVVLTADDPAIVRKKQVNLPRVNAIFELGLFFGRLERKRCFFLVDGDSDTNNAADLAGLMPVKFYKDSVDSMTGRCSLETQAKIVRAQMLALKRSYKPTPEIRARQEKLWCFSSRISGFWWERMRSGDADMSALSYIVITVDDMTNTPRLEGMSYDLSGEYLAEWKSVVSGVELVGSKPFVYYRWEVEIDDAIGQRYGGGGQFVFDDMELRTAKDYFYDTNYALIHGDAKTRLKRFGLYRCEQDEVERMYRPWSEDAKSLRIKKMSTLRGR